MDRSISPFELDEQSFTREEVDMWGENPLVNPRTHQKILPGEDTYQRLETAYCEFNHKLVITLFNAVMDGNMNRVREILAKGVPIDIQYWDTNPLRFAVDNGHTETVRELLALGADPNLKVRSTMHIHSATQVGCLEILHLLLENGADPNRYDDYGYTILHTIALFDEMEVEGGIDDQNIRQMQMRKKRLKIVRMLLEYGADPNYKEDSDELDSCKTPLQIAKSEGLIHILKTCGQLDIKDPGFL